MKYQRASIVLAFFVLSAFLSCTEQESASPQEIAAADAVELHAADIAEEPNSPAIYQASVEIIAEQAPAEPPEPVYFQPLAADETLATLRTDHNTTQILAISLERNTYRLIHELSGAPAWLSSFRFSDDARSAFLGRRLRNGVPFMLYHIDGENGVISYLLDVGLLFDISSDGRFAAFVPALQAARNTVWLFSVETADVIAQFEVTIDGHIALNIVREGESNFSVSNAIYEWGWSNAQWLLDTENLTLQMNEESGSFPPLDRSMSLAVPVLLNETAQKLFLPPILLRQTVMFSTVFNGFPTFFLKIN